MKRHHPQTFLRCVTTHLRPVSRPRSRPASIQALCEWRSGPGPRGAAKTAEQTQLLSGPGGCNVTWRHPAGLCGIWGRAQVHCALRATAAPVHASWIILPCHLHCAQVWAHRTGILTAWGSVGERFSPGESRGMLGGQMTRFRQNFAAEKVLQKEAIALSNTYSQIAEGIKMVRRPLLVTSQLVTVSVIILQHVVLKQGE